LAPFLPERFKLMMHHAPRSVPPSIFTALQEQLNLKLESQTGSVDVLVIDHVEEPSPNRRQ
jgi:uncharacterized protein (TIGR03435 family)